jgi:ribosomal protein S7
LIQKRVEEMRRNGQDVSPIVKVMQRLGPALQAGKTEEAEQIVAEALKLLGEKEK